MELEKAVAILAEQYLSLESRYVETQAELLTLKQILLTLGEGLTSTPREDLVNQMQALKERNHAELLERAEDVSPALAALLDRRKTGGE